MNRLTNPTRQLAAGIAAAQTCALYNITDPVAEIPLLVLINNTAREYHRAVVDLATAEAAWRSFSARNTQDDPAHAEHHQRVMAARALLADLTTQLTQSFRDHDRATGAETDRVVVREDDAVVACA
jgi:hypothetical protein